jgi:hypothetical protein
MVIQTRRVITMKKALMFLALCFALSAPVGGIALTLVAGMTAVTTHPQESVAPLQHLRHS